jgi:S-adenosylmethionine decarboxylase
LAGLGIPTYAEVQDRKVKEAAIPPDDRPEHDVADGQLIGKHVYGNLYGCNSSINSESTLRKLVTEAAKVAKMTVWDTKVWKFGGDKGGVSALALILESHIAIHTWNEFQYATVDVFTSGENSDPLLAFDYIVMKLKPKSVTKHFADRSKL